MIIRESVFARDAELNRLDFIAQSLEEMTLAEGMLFFAVVSSAISRRVFDRLDFPILVF